MSTLFSWTTHIVDWGLLPCGALSYLEVRITAAATVNVNPTHHYAL